MRDSEVVAAIVAGDPDGLAEAYDRYASPLYTYCRSLLREPGDAADAVHDTFVLAASRLAGLRDRNRLRPWLYAVARNECHRLLRSRAAQVPTPLDEIADVTDASADADAPDGAERAELRMLMRSAVRGLGAGEQDLIELQLRQGLDVAEIAAVLGVSRNHAHALLSRARGQLEASLGALLVARSGRGDCDVLSGILDDWDGELTVLMRKRINRHIERCPACRERKKRELAPALLLGAAPLAALPGAMSARLWKRVLRLASSDSVKAAAHRARVARRTGGFGRQGFPKPLARPKSPWLRPRAGQAAAAVASVAAVATAGTLIAMSLTAGSNGHHGGPAALGQGADPGASSVVGAGGSPAGPGQHAASAAPAGGTIDISPSPAADNATMPAGGAPGAGQTPSYWTAAGRAGAAGSSSAAGSSAAGSSAAGSSAAGRGSAGSSAGSTVTSGSGTSAAGSSAAGSSGGGTASSSAPKTGASSPAAAPADGTLSVSPTSLVLSLGGAGSFTLTASGGPVDWSIGESSSLVGHLTVSPASGRLAAGQSTTVTVSAGLLTLAGSLTVEPAGITLSITVGTDLLG